MDIRREKSSEFQSSWMPETPVKPIVRKPQLICTDREENRPGHANWFESERFSQETQAHGMVACCDSTNSIAINRDFYDQQTAVATRSPVSGDNVCMYDFPDRWNDIPFGDLLALADAATLQENINAASNPQISVFDSHIEANWVDSSHYLSLGTNLWSNNNCARDIPQCGSSNPSRPTYDLNSPPRTDAVSSRTISPQFAPITPDQAKRVENREVSNIPNRSVDERTNQARDAHENEVPTTRVEVSKLHHDEEQSQLLKVPAHDIVSTPLQEDHNPDKGGNHVIDLNKTPQQKQRRKKHRPKVIIEGKPKRTRKPVTPKPAGSKENPTVKRKYVRKNGLNKSTATPSAEVTSETTDSKTAGHNAKSSRRSLNFDFESQVRDESSSPMPPSNHDSESQAQNYYTRIQSKSTMQLGRGKEVMVEKTPVGIAYDLTRSLNQVLEGYMSMPERQAPGPSTPTKTDPPHEKLKDGAQNECTRGKCQIVFSNETHDKQGSTVQMINTDTQSAPRSPNNSNCSSSACLTKREQARGLKRTHWVTIDDSVNEIGGQYNALQAYQMFPVTECNNNKNPGMHFPAIYKKKRTHKGHNSATSSTLSTATAAENNVGQATVYPMNDACANPLTSKGNCISYAAHFNTSTAPTRVTAVVGAQNKQQTFECMLALGHTERLTKKRSKGPTRVRDLASLVVDCRQLPAFPAKGAPTSGNVQGFGASHQPHTCMEALVADTRPTMATKKRTKRSSLGIYSHQQSLTKSIGPPDVICKYISPIDAIVEQLMRLDINAETNQVAYQERNALVRYNMRYREQNALVLYRRDGTVVPFEGSFDPVKKRKPRAKVELDEETNRVWKLLLENINSEGIDGTDEHNAKWWEEERRVFHGRADSFIARMHLVQGDRRFSQWKGSVVDSVVGVFLTQNVSDHLSSSAFMSVAARFPLKSKSNHGSCSEERTSTLVNKPDICILDLEDTIRWHEEKSNHPACDRSSMTLHEVAYNEEKFVNSIEFLGSNTDGVRSTDNSSCELLDSFGNGLETCDESAVNRSTAQIPGAASSFMGDQTEVDDVLSSQNSVDSSIAQNANRIRHCLQSNSEADLTARSKSKSFGGSTSFVELLQMAGTTMLHGVYNHVSGNVSCNKKDEHNQEESTECDSQKQKKNRLDGSKASLAPVIPSSNYRLHMTPNAGALEVECFDMLEESRYPDNSKKNEENCMSEQSVLTAESVSQAAVQKTITVSSQEGPISFSESNHPCNDLQGEVNKIFQSQGRPVGDPTDNIELLTQKHNCKMQEVLEVTNFSGETVDVTGSTGVTDNPKNTDHKAIESNLNDNGHLPGKTVNRINADTSKAKRGRIGKEKQAAVDWDILRKQAQANFKRRERTANTMDSLDWEAVRCADVKEIANTIRERGMNNMLAERIKDFLNRLVREHGSIDLEWLRDVPPDKAKEYLLSIRGLGLKSVECVRLLTLHHLAFPVDTNVGRIAVRLGWVPLQPLPESLQLHLLELYPVLESIQKYLWPRLCKLDQKTLYELHYQMITFGKVFCTKSKPNCNACPMRGECRHFASAFASARLALPGPEEKSIVSATENKAANQNPVGMINPLQLLLPRANQQPEAQSGINNCEPIIEVPATPEPIIEVPATPEPERTIVPEIDIEDTCEDPDEIPTIKLNIEEFTQNLQNYMQQNMELQEDDMSKALVALTPEVASIPVPKLKNVSRLRTEHQVYELPDSHPLLEGLDKREPDDPSSYLLAIWTPGETANSIQQPEGSCSSQDFGKLCDEKTCFSCNSIREANSQTVRGTLLIPCRTAMRGSFPLNGTYFQVNEVFADHESSINPIDVPRAWIWNLPRRTVYFGTSVTTIFKGLSTEGIQYCFWRGFVCVRGFDQKTRAPRPLMARLHFPASKLIRTKGKPDDK
uniref:Putative transcriptional activator DEMETER-like n=1 Tax=Davidia involucrata TaxID=16924 RepID=A0A5B7A684_DAVIN